jgi:hypothetical protein
LHAAPRPFTLRCGPAVSHRSARRRCGHKAVDRFIQANALPRLGCVRHHPPRTGGLSIRVEVRSRVPVHTRWQLSRNAIVSRHSRIAEIQLSHACGTSETQERSSGMETIYGTQTTSETETICGTQTISETETIYGTQTICGMETIRGTQTICGVTGKNTFSLTAQGVGIATGTATATIGGMATNAPSLMDRG